MCSSKPAPQAAPTGARVLAVAALAPALAVAWQSTALCQRDLAFTAAETEVSFWGRGEYLPGSATRQRTERAVEALLAESPAQPDYLQLAASLFAWQGYWASDPWRETGYIRRAVEAQWAAQENRSAYRPGWELLETYADRAGDSATAELARTRLAALHSRSSSAAPNPQDGRP